MRDAVKLKEKVPKVVKFKLKIISISYNKKSVKLFGVFMRKYFLIKQVSVIDRQEKYYFYNWMNDIGVSIEKYYIDEINDNEVTFNQKFSEEYIKYLFEKKFFKDSNFSIDFYKKEYQEQISKENNILNLILLPSGYSCNFRCLYCYENHLSSKMYGEKESDQIFSIIQKNKNKILSIEYFGGEPLLNLKWILSFQKRILHITKCVSSMTTNGYLLTKQNFLSLVNVNVKSFQVTLDGIQKYHDNFRPKANGESTFQKIFKNIKDISTLKENFIFVIRCNFNETTSSEEDRSSFFELFNFLKGDYRFRFIFRPIGLYSDANGTTTEKNIEVLCRRTDFKDLWEKEAQKRGFLLGDLKMYVSKGGSICYASKRSTIVLDNDLQILKCTVAVDRDFNHFGNIKEGINIDDRKIERWEEYISFNKKCSECFFFFQCMGRSCVLKNFNQKKNACPINKGDKRKILDKIILQKENLKNWRERR